LAVSGFIGALAVGCDAGQSSHHTASTGPGGGGTGGSTSSGLTTSSSGTASTGGSTTSSTSTTTTSTSTAASSSSTTTTASSSSGTPTNGLHVSGNKLMDGSKVVRLLGVDHSGSEYMCIQGNGFFDGPVDQSSVNEMLSWHVNAVRVPLNEDCWLAINGAPGQYAGTAYVDAIQNYVGLLRQNNIYVILDLHWNGGGGQQATGQQNMADSDHAPAFWTGVANAFKGDLGVVFDLYNEPHNISWGCWKSGGCQVNGWNVAGMDQLIMAVRSTGAQNVVMAGGNAYASDLTQWLANKPNDPMGNLAASFHTYNFTGCSNQGCWGSTIASVAAQVPVVTGELGENDCAHGYIDQYMPWATCRGPTARACRTSAGRGTPTSAAAAAPGSSRTGAERRRTSAPASRLI
jgi:hypothetical protein